MMRLQNIGKLFGIGVIALVVAGCGGGGGGGSTPVEPAPPPAPVDPMTEKDVVLIIYNYPEDVCLSSTLREKMENLSADSSNFLFYVENNNIGCGTYGKNPSITEKGGCMTEDASDSYPYTKYDTSCVVGYDTDLVAGISTNTEFQALDIEEKVSILNDSALEAL